MTVGANLWGEQGEQHLRHWQMVERKSKGIHQGTCSEMELTHPNALHNGLLDSERRH